MDGERVAKSSFSLRYGHTRLPIPLLRLVCVWGGGREGTSKRHEKKSASKRCCRQHSCKWKKKKRVDSVSL